MNEDKRWKWSSEPWSMAGLKFGPIPVGVVLLAPVLYVILTEIFG